MQSRSKLKPGQKRTKKLVELYGSRLVCVRYRYDEGLQKRFKFDDWTGNEDVLTLCQIYIQELDVVIKDGVAKGFITG